jgi:hypothetical protein
MSSADQRRPDGPIKNPQDLGAGLFLLAIAAIGFFGSINLTFGQLSGVGAGMMPRAGSVLVAAFGVLLIVQSLFLDGPFLERWSLRGPFFVLGSAVIFAYMIRPFGLVLAGPIAVVFCSFADKDTRIVEVIIYAVIMTAFCGLLFKELLGLPIPFDPIGVIPDALGNGYASIKKSIWEALLSLTRR